MKSFVITLDYPEYKVETQIIKKNKGVTPEPALTYYWYTPGKIVETKGGFDGRLLQGYYHAFYLNRQLKETGEFKLGVKDGEWKSWYPDGKQKELVTWRQGRKNGIYILYNELGNKMAEGQFKNDLLDGTFYTFDNRGNPIIEKNYKAGEEILKEPSRVRDGKEQKVKKKLFRRKKQTDTDTDKGSKVA